MHIARFASEKLARRQSSRQFGPNCTRDGVYILYESLRHNCCTAPLFISFLLSLFIFLFCRVLPDQAHAWTVILRRCMGDCHMRLNFRTHTQSLLALGYHWKAVTLAASQPSVSNDRGGVVRCPILLEFVQSGTWTKRCLVGNLFSLVYCVHGSGSGLTPLAC